MGRRARRRRPAGSTRRRKDSRPAVPLPWSRALPERRGAPGVTAAGEAQAISEVSRAQKEWAGARGGPRARGGPGSGGARRGWHPRGRPRRRRGERRRSVCSSPTSQEPGTGSRDIRARRPSRDGEGARPGAPAGWSRYRHAARPAGAGPVRPTRDGTVPRWGCAVASHLDCGSARWDGSAVGVRGSVPSRRRGLRDGTVARWGCAVLSHLDGGVAEMGRFRGGGARLCPISTAVAPRPGGCASRSGGQEGSRLAK